MMEDLARPLTVVAHDAPKLAVKTGMIRNMERVDLQDKSTRCSQVVIEGVPVDVVYYARFCP